MSLNTHKNHLITQSISPLDPPFHTADQHCIMLSLFLQRTVHTLILLIKITNVRGVLLKLIWAFFTLRE